MELDQKSSKSSSKHEKMRDMEITSRPGGLGMLELAPSNNCSKLAWTSWYLWPPYLSALKVIYAVEKKIRIVPCFNIKASVLPWEHPGFWTLRNYIFNPVMVLEFLLLSKLFLFIAEEKKRFIFLNLCKLKGKLCFHLPLCSSTNVTLLVWGDRTECKIKYGKSFIYMKPLMCFYSLLNSQHMIYLLSITENWTDVFR